MINIENLIVAQVDSIWATILAIKISLAFEGEIPNLASKRKLLHLHRESLEKPWLGSIAGVFFVKGLNCKLRSLLMSASQPASMVIVKK